ncbi:MAG TPA: hypothetical protein VMC02_08580 [Steroidobacteraceae bacterium]|nr:hypothetical protein [Steroidobacteraceae bacterium]
MNSSDRTRGDPLGAPAQSTAVAAPLAGTEEYGSWLDRMQRARTRHAAITRNLYTWSNYKSWADQVKGSWEQEPERK